MVCIPPFELSTSMARSVLPKEISIKDIYYNIRSNKHIKTKELIICINSSKKQNKSQRADSL